ncbi:MAG: hypothetical protein ACOVNU_11730 [Candidatus Kapaibacteriota bacterium]
MENLDICLGENGTVSIFSSDTHAFCKINNIFLCNETSNGSNCSKFDMVDKYSNEYVGQIDVIG